MKKVLVIYGPTATGKTNLAVFLAKKLNGEIVSADSQQVYSGMDIVTGKDLLLNAKEIKKTETLSVTVGKYTLYPYRFETVPVWLLDIVEPSQQFNLSSYITCAKGVIEDIFKRDRMPIIVGGTNFYIKSLLIGGETFHIPLNTKLRNDLEKKTVEELQQQFSTLDSEKFSHMNNSDKHNPRRLIRAIEVATYKDAGNIAESARGIDYEYKKIGLMAPFPFLFKHIDERVDKRVADGALEETRRLLHMYGREVIQQRQTGYTYLVDVIEGTRTIEEAVQKWKQLEHDVARKQYTFAKKDTEIQWFDIKNIDLPTIAQRIKSDIDHVL